MYRVDFGRYPTESEGLAALFDIPEGQKEKWRGPYLASSDKRLLALPLFYQSHDGSSYTLGLVLNKE